MTSTLNKYIAESLRDNDYLRGDDCRSTRSYLKGWIGSVFRRAEGRRLTSEEEVRVDEKIDEFVREAP